MHWGAGISLRISLGFPDEGRWLFFHRCKGNLCFVSEVSAHGSCPLVIVCLFLSEFGSSVCAPASPWSDALWLFSLSLWLALSVYEQCLLRSVNVSFLLLFGH